MPDAVPLPLLSRRPTATEAVEGRPNSERLRDRYGRAITDIRLSVTDRCNFRCIYCRTGIGTGDSGDTLGELPLAAYARLLRLFVGLGVEKVRFTGGEPLFRRGLLDLIRESA